METPRQTAKDIAEVLIGEIRDGAVADGSPLPPERQLCERFDTSRPTIRAALMKMQMRGYASLETSRRPRAKKPSIGSIFEVASESFQDLLGDTHSSAHLEQIRQFIEVAAVRSAALEATNLQIAQIHAALEQGFAALEDDLAFGKADAAFHRATVSVVQNPIILELHDRFVTQMVARRAANKCELERNQVSYEEHRQIYEAIADGDSERAMLVMDAHLARSFRARLAKPGVVELKQQDLG